MSTPPLLINETLCYVSCKYGRIASKQLKSILANFYNCEQISTAKEVIVNQVDLLDNVGKWLRPPRRRKESNGTDVNKVKVEVDDILAVFTYIDEMKLIDRLPRFVAANPDLLPSNSWSEGDLFGLIARFDRVEVQLASVQDKLETNQSSMRCEILKSVETAQNSICSSLNIQLSSLNQSRNLNQRKSRADIIRATDPAMLTDESDECSQPVRTWANVTNPDYSNAPKDDFSVVIGKKRKKMMSGPISDRTDSPALHPETALKQVHKQQMKLIGTSDNPSLLKAAKPLDKKAVYCVQNLDPSTTAEDLIKFASTLDVRILTCFETKTRFTDTKSFRVCINADDCELFLDPTKWSSHIVLRQWTFKAHKPEGNSVFVQSFRPQSISSRDSAAAISHVNGSVVAAEIKT
jgi:hypothetical protein